MATRPWIALLAAALVLWLAAPTMADWFDEFSDGEYQEAPTPFDIDDPCWVISELLGTYWEHGVEYGWLRLYSYSVIAISALMAHVDSGDPDPNTSATYWDDTSSHYMLMRAVNPSPSVNPFGYDYPDDYAQYVDNGGVYLLMHLNPATWLMFWLTYEFYDDQPWKGGYFSIQSCDALDSHTIRSASHIRGYRDYRHYPLLADIYYDPNDPNYWVGRPSWGQYIDPNFYPNWPSNNVDPNTYDPLDPNWDTPPLYIHLYDPNDPNWQDPRDPNWIMYDPNMLDPNNMWADPGYMDERNGFWLVFQFESDGVTGDPNGKWFRADCWNGGKYDWDGTWRLARQISGDIDNDPDPKTSWWPEGYYTEGICGLGTGAAPHMAGGPISDAAYDGLEVRTGIFTNTWRTLTIKMKDCCDLNLEPNVSHPDGGEKRRYTNGTPIVLDTVVPCGNKVFKKWTIKGPNDSGDPLYQIVTDTNEVVYVTMDGDYLVKATCKCGGGGIEPFAGVVLLVLGLGVLFRRLT